MLFLVFTFLLFLCPFVPAFGHSKRSVETNQESGGAKSQTAANGKQNICLLSSFSPHLKSHLTSKGEKNPFASLLEERRAPHQPGAGSALSGVSFSFICATLPSALMEPVIKSALYSSLMLFHSHFVEVVSLPWQKHHILHVRLWVVVSDWWLVLLPIPGMSLPPSTPCHRAGHRSAPSHRRAKSPSEGRDWPRLVRGCKAAQHPDPRPHEPEHGLKI